MVSTKNTHHLPDRQKLQSICKAISVLDAVLSQEWEYRYYSYNSKWFDGEECFEMRDGSGNQMLILFRDDGCVINGFSPKFEQQNKAALTHNLPAQFNEFLFGEPVKSIGTTFCIWTTKLNQWQTGIIDNYQDYSEEMLTIFDGNPQTYIDWATSYYEGDFIKTGIPINTAAKIYNGESLTKEMVLSLVDELEDWEQLEEDLAEIDYPFDFKKETLDKKNKWKFW